MPENTALAARKIAFRLLICPHFCFKIPSLKGKFMKKPAKIDIEALTKVGPDIHVDEEIAQEDASQIHGDSWNTPRNTDIDFSDPVVSALVQWLGRDKVLEFSVDEIEYLRTMIGRLPEPVSSSSFAWEVVKTPADVRKIVDAVVIYRRFNHAAVKLSEIMGNNDVVRKIIRLPEIDPETTLAGYLQGKKKNHDLVVSFFKRLADVKTVFQDMFKTDNLSINATVIAAAAAQTLPQSFEHMKFGFVLPVGVTDGAMGELDKMRRHLVSAAEKVKRMCGINVMKLSRPALAGVRRSLGDESSGNFAFAVEGLGGRIEDDVHLVQLSQAFVSYFQQYEIFWHTMKELGLEKEHEPQLLARLLLRRHFMSAARTAEIEWDYVSQELEVNLNADFDALQLFVTAFEAPGLSGQLKAVASKTMDRPIDEAIAAARKHIVTNEYWMDVADRIVAFDPDIRFLDLRELLRMEPEIEAARASLHDVGANTSDDVDTLERHMDWMTMAFALPISDDAIERVVETRAEIIPMRLCSNE